MERARRRNRIAREVDSVFTGCVELLGCTSAISANGATGVKRHVETDLERFVLTL